MESVGIGFADGSAFGLSESIKVGTLVGSDLTKDRMLETSWDLTLDP